MSFPNDPTPWADEAWRPVLGYEGLYEVSSLGQVRSVSRYVKFKDGRKPRYYQSQPLRQRRGRHYYCVNLSSGGARLTKCIHHLVCEAFHGPRPTGQVVRHLNGDYLDNRAENLVWGTHAENSADMVRHGHSHWLNQTHCKHGHEFTPENTRVDVSRSSGGQRRNCRTCERSRQTFRNRARDRRMAEERPFHACEVCGEVFKVPNRRSRLCSTECKKAARRKEFKSRKTSVAA